MGKDGLSVLMPESQPRGIIRETGLDLDLKESHFSRSGKAEKVVQTEAAA